MGWKEFLEGGQSSPMRELATCRSELEVLQQRLELILENAPVLIYVVDESARFLGVNRAWRQIVPGLQHESLVGRSLYDVLPTEVAAAFERNNLEVMRAGEVRQFEEVNDGRVYLSVKVPVKDADGRPHAICGMSVDITERKKAELALTESEGRFRDMADGLPLIIWVHDEKGEQEFVNQTFCEYFGVTREEMKGGKWQILMHPDDAAQYVSAFQRSVSAHSAFHAETRVRRAGGDWRWLESWGRPRFGTRGEFRGFVGTSADVTERKETAQRLEASEAALRESDRRKDEFLAALGHELRNPLAPIRNVAQLLRTKVTGDPTIALACEIVERQTNQLVRIVDDLLDVSRVTLGKVTLQQEVLDLRDVMEDATHTAQPLMREKSHQMKVSVPDEPIWVRGDRVRLSQVFGNLLANAARYTSPGGLITVRAWEEGSSACVSVGDNGKGIAAENLSAIFDLFHQTATESGSGGLGIGLTLVRRFVEMHGGLVQAHSDGVGKGSTFVVRLHKAPAPDSADHKYDAPALASLKILIVDDNVDLVESQAQVFRLDGHQVETATQGAASLALAEAFAPDVVLLDLGMPKMDGYAVARALRRSPRAERMIIIAQTGWGHSGIARDITAAGFDAYVRKGADANSISALIHSLRQERVATLEARPEGNS
jgi:PAS domain S-box-containing protein